MSGDHKDGIDRHLVRLLRSVEIAGTDARLLGPTGGNCEIRYRGRAVTFAASLVGTCERNALIVRRGEKVELTHEGLAALRRLQHPDAGYLVQHGELSQRTLEMPTGTQRVTVNDAESPLTRLYARKGSDGKTWLSSSQFAAGERLRADFERGRLQPRVTATLDRPISRGTGKGAELSDFAFDARRRVERALDALEPELAGVALDVCCFLKGLEQVERERRWPPRSAKLMLRTALTILAGHYGLEARADARRRTVLHWGDADYRPSL